MDIRNILTALAVWLVAGWSLAQSKPEQPEDRREIRSEIRERARTALEQRVKGASQGAGEQKRIMRPRPFLIMGDPRFEKMSRLLFVPEPDLDAAISTWAQENGRDEEDTVLARRFLKHLRSRMERRAGEYARDKGLVIDEENREEFFREFLQLNIEAEQATRRKAEADLKKRREVIDRQLMGKFGEP